jgi:hypothetical protein
MTFSAPGHAMPAKAPSRAWYILSALIWLLGFGAAGVLLAVQIPKLGDRLTQVVVPGEAALNLTEPGTYTIFHERESVVDGKVYSSRNISGLRVALRTAQGEQIRVSGPAASSRYNFGGRSGVGLFTFEIAAPGTYRLSAAYDDGRAQPRAVLAIGAGFVSSMLAMIFGGIAFAFAGTIVAVLVAVMVFVKRRKARPMPMTMAATGARPPTVS